jgi:hypothetical protein
MEFFIYRVRNILINMKKFSNVTNQKVGEEPKKKLDQNKEEEKNLKFRILGLLEQCLTVRPYGPINRYFTAGTIKIQGKEMFVEALVNLLKEKSLKDETKILESLKSEIGDWQIIDSKIDSVKEKIENLKEENTILKHRQKLESMWENWGQDSELLLQMIDESCKKITDSETAKLRALSAEYMSHEGYPKELFLQISEKFSQRSQQIQSGE